MKLLPNLALTFVNRHQDKFKLSHSVVQQMRLYVQDSPSKREAGGILLGRFICHCADVVVDQITIPVTGDKRERSYFYRSARYHQKEIDNAWLLSSGTCNYLGEWHTHAEADPSPSALDFSEWHRKLSSDQFDSEVLYFVIMGAKQINAWQGHKKSRKIEKLNRLD